METSDRVLITGAAGFVGSRVFDRLLKLGFSNIACFVRTASKSPALEAIVRSHSPHARVDIIIGNLLSPKDCEAACRGAKVIFHLAAGTGGKSYPDAFLNSVVTTRNLLEASVQQATLRRIVLVSSFAVYSNRQKACILDESCPIEFHPERRDAYCYTKVRQEQIVQEYANKYMFGTVVVRPGSVYGAGQHGITGRVGLGTFGLFLHLGGSNRIPFTYVDNCAAAIVLAGLVTGIDGEAFNVVDDDLPSSRQFLRSYKKQVHKFNSLYVPHALSYLLCLIWEKYSQWSMGQLPPTFTVGTWYSLWRKTQYNNRKLKQLVGWYPQTRTEDALQQYFSTLQFTRQKD
ncbi:MAG: NAD(P)-dependent oxidoreductase [Silvibacterium sp.]